MQAKDFLLHELDNIERTLHETLRHDYPPGNGQEFYEECITRIERLRAKTAAIGPTDFRAISQYSVLVSQVSLLISLIERSHLGEFSWPFAFRLGEIASEICQEPGPAGPLPPIIQILADGGTASYRIYTESYWPSILRYRRILHIVFPRTNKYHVLLHSIFGHEIGHAAYAIPSIQSRLNAQVFTPLFTGTPLADEASAEAWITSTKRPKEITEYLGLWSNSQPHDFTFLGKNNYAIKQWQQELFCDLFGTILFGPSFAGAQNTLLGSVSPAGETFSDTHPPYASRANLISRALSRLKWLNYGPSGNTELDNAIASTAKFLLTVPSADPWYELFTDKNVDDAIGGLTTILSSIPDTLYVRPTISDLSHITDNLCRRVPPCGSRLHPTEAKPEPFALDFRHILYGGWIAWIGREDLKPSQPLDFFQINRLCDRGILQQIAVERSRP